jgi:hypothetical protein
MSIRCAGLVVRKEYKEYIQNFEKFSKTDFGVEYVELSGSITKDLVN